RGERAEEAERPLRRPRTSQKDWAPAVKATVERPAVIVGLGLTVCTTVKEVGQLLASSPIPVTVFPSRSTITWSLNPEICAPPAIATTSRLNATPATLVWITPVIALGAVLVSKALKLLGDVTVTPGFRARCIPMFAKAA